MKEKKIMTTEEIIEDISSRDTHRVWHASCEIMASCQDPARIKPLIPYLPLIIKSTKGLKMGGAFAPNQRFIDFALRTIKFHRDSPACPCCLYQHLEVIDPNKEEEKGFIRISNTERIENKWVDYYEANCTRCGQKYNIIERSGHYMWWKWQRVD